MPGDFHLLELYRDLCQDLDEAMDQQVPQTGSYTQEQTDPVTVKVEPELLCQREFPDALMNMTSSALPAPSAGCITVTEVPDQQLHSGQSPSHLTDLDLYTGNHLTLYDQSVMDVKPAYSHTLRLGEVDGTDEGFEAALYYLVTKDIMDECCLLKINIDPMCWSSEDVRKWIVHLCKKYSIPGVNINRFHYNGKDLCGFTEQNFELLSPKGGSHLFAHLQIWKNYCQIEDIETMRMDCYQPEGGLAPGCALDGYHCQSPSPYSMSPESPDSSSLDSAGSSPQRPSSLDDSLYPIQAKFQDKPPKTEVIATRPTEHKQTIHLWQFLKELLHKPETFSSCIKWIDRSKGIFKIEDSSKVAKEWGRRKNRPAMNYDKLSRSIRQYYKKGIIKKTEHSKRLVYQFCAPYL